MFKQITACSLFIFMIIQCQAQIQVSKLLGKNANNYKPGYGAFLKFSYPVSEGDDVSLEGGVNFFFEKDDDTYAYGIANVPVKLGYRYTLNRTGTGIYIEPQAGYNAYGVNSYYSDGDGKDVDEKFHGIVAGAGVGYLFQPAGIIQFDLSLRYESVFYKGSTMNYASIRLAHNFSFRKKESDY